MKFCVVSPLDIAELENVTLSVLIHKGCGNLVIRLQVSLVHVVIVTTDLIESVFT